MNNFLKGDNMANLRPKHKIAYVETGKDSAVLRINLWLPMSYGWFESVKIYIIGCNSYELNGKEFRIPHKRNKAGYAEFQTEIRLETSAQYYYYFSYKCQGWYTLMKKKNISGSNHITKEECFKLSVNFSVPDWAKGEGMYHILVDRFYRGAENQPIPMLGRTINKWGEPPVLGPNDNNDWNVDYYGGDLKGITQKLDYIRSLGATILYLSPIHFSQSNHGYDTIDYEMIDPYFGSWEDLEELCTEAHKRKMRVIVDGVYNHTGNRSKYYDQYDEFGEGEYNHPDTSPYKDFFQKNWHNGKKYYNYWWDIETMPKFDTINEDYRKYITGKGGIIDKLMNHGVDGLRLDVADELSDPMIEDIHTAIERNKTKDGFLFGEVWEKNPIKENRGYMKSGKGLQAIMNYNLVDALMRYYKYQDVTKLREKTKEILTEYPRDTILSMMNFTSTHDMSRLIEVFGCNCFDRGGTWAWDSRYSNASDFVKDHKLTKEEYEYGKKIVKAYLVSLAFFPGIFSIFYGDEIGMQGFGNLANRGSFPWGKGDMELLAYYKNLMKARNSNKFLKYADTEILDINQGHFMYERTLGYRKILVVTSRTHHWHSEKIKVPGIYTNADVIFKGENSNLQKMEPYGTMVLRY